MPNLPKTNSLSGCDPKSERTMTSKASPKVSLLARAHFFFEFELSHSKNDQKKKQDWNDGRAICALVDALRPGLIPDHKAMNPANGEGNATKGIDTAYDKLGVAKLILPNEMANPKVDEQAMMTYISQFRDLPLHEEDPAEKCSAYGPGLVEGMETKKKKNGCYLMLC